MARHILSFGDLRRRLRPAAALSREIPVWPQVQSIRNTRRPCVVFLPHETNTGASRLRVYEMARALEPLGWSTLCLPPRLNLAQRSRFIALANPVAIVMQNARHPLNRPEFFPDRRIFFDIDDADFHLPHLSDATRAAVAQVDAVLAGSRYIANWATREGARETHVLWTGTPVSSQRSRPHYTRAPIIAWAQSRPTDYCEEANLVRHVMHRVAGRRPGVTLRLFDRRPQDGFAFAQSFSAPGLTVEWVETADYSTYLRTLDSAAIGLAPLCPTSPFSRGKSFGKVLAYLDRDVPVIGSDAGEHGAFFTTATGLISNDPDVWVAGITALIDAPLLRDDVASKARADFKRHLSIDAAAARLSRVLSKHLAGDAPAKAS